MSLDPNNCTRCMPKTNECTIVEEGDPQNTWATGALYWGTATWDGTNFTYRIAPGTRYLWGEYSISAAAINNLGCVHVAKGNAVKTKRLANGTYIRSHFGMRYNPTTKTFASNVAESPYKTTAATATTYFTTRATGASSTYQYALLFSF